MKRIKTLQLSIFTTVLFLNSGCFLGYFETPKAEITTNHKRTSIKPVTEQPKKRVSLSAVQSPLVDVECTNDINSPCQKDPISPKELKPRKITRDGEVHKLRSIQGQNITIIERKTGFIFPQYKNKVVILELFGKNCSHCIKEIPVMRRLHQKYRNKLEIIAVQVEDRMTPSERRRLLHGHRIKYPIIPGDDATNLQYNIQKTYGWTGILPYTLVIKNGVTEFNYGGEVSYQEIHKDIRSILY